MRCLRRGHLGVHVRIGPACHTRRHDVSWLDPRRCPTWLRNMDSAATDRPGLVPHIRRNTWRNTRISPALIQLSPQGTVLWNNVLTAAIWGAYGGLFGGVGEYLVTTGRRRILVVIVGLGLVGLPGAFVVGWLANCVGSGTAC